MAIPTEKAYELLNLPLGASKDCILQSYKKLAFKWHPEKYTTTKNTQEALKKFKSINIAYRKLINNGDDKDMSLHEMFEQYRQVFNKKKEKVLNAHMLADIKNNNSTEFTNSHKNSNNKSLLELVNNNNNNNNFINNKNNGHFFGNQMNLNLIKNTKLKLLNDKNNNDEENYENHFQMLRQKEDTSQSSDQSIKLKAKSFAIKGNEMAKQGEFQKAIEKFTEAIKFDYTDHRLYGNRSYCYDKINLFQDALDDAEKAIYLEPLWPKGYFRKGRALSGLKMYKEAEEAYEKVLEFENTDDPELEEELNKVRSLQLQEMGFSKLQSETAIRNNLTVQAALESIFVYTKEKNNKCPESSSDIDENDFDYNENDSENEKKEKTNFNSSSSSSSSTTSYQANENNNLENNGFGAQNQTPSTSLWIGNVDPDVTEEILFEMFSQYGQLANVRCLPEKYCAFVNFKIKEDAQKAMQNLQGKFLEGQRLLIKYPDNPNTVLLSSLVTKNQKSVSEAANKKLADTTGKGVTAKKKSVDVNSEARNAAALEALKLTGPVNGNECYFWRTTGCLYADKCRYEHLKKSRGIDKKPWHK